nr:EOG090X07UV [Cyclestheria hislopi]
MSLTSEPELISEEELRLRISLSPPVKGPMGLAPEKSGLNHPVAISLLILWYIFSAFTLFANKYIISFLKGDPALLAMHQMLMCMTLGFIQLQYTCGLFTSRSTALLWGASNRPKFLQHSMITLGALRFGTLVLGLISLNYTAVSFTETVKSSAPLFTVVIARILVGEKTGLYVNLSLIPIMAGLALCSATELSFNIPGFIAAIFTNLTECLQNVYSKSLLSNEKLKYGPAELQFNTSVASLVIQIFASFFLVDWGSFQFSFFYIGVMMLNGMFFHFQSITEYALLEHITPVTHSVANTVKRAFLIWLSILLFGNPITGLSAAGTLAVTGGVLLYNRARQLDAMRIQRIVEILPQKISL